MNKKEFKTDELKVKVASQVFSSLQDTHEELNPFEVAKLSVDLAKFIIECCQIEDIDLPIHKK